MAATNREGDTTECTCVEAIPSGVRTCGPHSSRLQANDMIRRTWITVLSSLDTITRAYAGSMNNCNPNQRKRDRFTRPPVLQQPSNENVYVLCQLDYRQVVDSSDICRNVNPLAAAASG